MVSKDLAVHASFCVYLIVSADILPERPEHDHGHNPSQEQCDHQGVHDREVVNLVLFGTARRGEMKGQQDVRYIFRWLAFS